MRKGNNVKIENKDGEIFRREKKCPTKWMVTISVVQIRCWGWGGLKVENLERGIQNYKGIWLM